MDRAKDVETSRPRRNRDDAAGVRAFSCGGEASASQTARVSCESKVQPDGLFQVLAPPQTILISLSPRSLQQRLAPYSSGFKTSACRADGPLCAVLVDKTPGCADEHSRTTPASSPMNKAAARPQPERETISTDNVSCRQRLARSSVREGIPAQAH
ncbi:hypothetical protein CDD83_9174 [Cordyceps sp. RAO-2017]|nr:hypothetical protein CDD83_9174 [Cordyceps sp. RAO-2017]